MTIFIEVMIFYEVILLFVINESTYKVIGDYDIIIILSLLELCYSHILVDKLYFNLKKKKTAIKINF